MSGGTLEILLKKNVESKMTFNFEFYFLLQQISSNHFGIRDLSKIEILNLHMRVCVVCFSFIKWFRRLLTALH